MGEFNIESGRRNDGMFQFEKNLDSLYSIMMVGSLFSCIVENARCQRTFDIVILAHYLERWYGMSLNARFGHLLFVLTAVVILF